MLRSLFSLLFVIFTVCVLASSLTMGVHSMGASMLLVICIRYVYTMYTGYINVVSDMY